MNNKFAAYFAIEKQLKATGYFPDRKELIHDFTQGRKQSLKDLEKIEYINFLNWLRNMFHPRSADSNWQKTPENIMRRKLWNIFCKEMDYSQNDFEGWLIQYGQFHKVLKLHSKEELQLVLVSAQKVLASFTKSIHI